MIIVHDGKAHRDDLLAAAICSFKTRKRIYRQKFTQEDLDNPQTFVLDQGRSFDPDFLNFDHHHIDEAICSFTQCLDYFYGKEYRKWFKWPEYIETYDAMGPAAVQELTKCPDLSYFSCPLVDSILDMFSKESGILSPFMSKLLYDIGSCIDDKISSMEKELALIDKAPRFIFNGYLLLDLRGIPLVEREGDTSSKVWERLRNIKIDIILADCKRTPGHYRLISTNTGKLNFSFFKNTERKDISFIHNSGFLITFDPIVNYEDILTEAIIRKD